MNLHRAERVMRWMTLLRGAALSAALGASALAVGCANIPRARIELHQSAFAGARGVPPGTYSVRVDASRSIVILSNAQQSFELDATERQAKVGVDDVDAQV